MSDQIVVSKPLFDAAGPPGAPALVLLHGSVVTRKMWLPQLRGLSDAFYVLAPDLPAHGVLAEVPFHFRTAINNLANLILTECGGKALVVGISLGGYTAIKLAARHSEMVAGLVLTGCSLNFTGLAGTYLKVVNALIDRGWIRQSRASAIERTRRMFPPELADVAEAQLADGVFPAALGQSFTQLAGRDFTIDLTRYDGPGLILNGENDKSSRKGEQKFLAAMKAGQVQVIPQAGHACNLHQPHLYNQALREFGQKIGWG